MAQLCCIAVYTSTCSSVFHAYGVIPEAATQLQQCHSLHWALCTPAPLHPCSMPLVRPACMACQNCTRIGFDAPLHAQQDSNTARACTARQANLHGSSTHSTDLQKISMHSRRLCTTRPPAAVLVVHAQHHSCTATNQHACCSLHKNHTSLLSCVSGCGARLFSCRTYFSATVSSCGAHLFSCRIFSVVACLFSQCQQFWGTLLQSKTALQLAKLKQAEFRSRPFCSQFAAYTSVVTKLQQIRVPVSEAGGPHVTFTLSKATIILQ